MTINKTIAQKRMEQRKKGFTLTEIAIVLGIIGLILGAIWTAAAAVYANQRTAHANTAVLQIAQGVRSLYASSSSNGYTIATDITPYLITSNSVPTDLVNGTGLVGPFPGGKTQVTATTDGNGFVVAMSNLTTAQCITLVTAVASQTRDPSLYLAGANAVAITPGNAAGTGTTTTAAALTSAATPALANTATISNGLGGCAAAATGLTVYFGFAVK